MNLFKNGKEVRVVNINSKRMENAVKVQNFAGGRAGCSQCKKLLLNFVGIVSADI